jgi:hypothetical protein
MSVVFADAFYFVARLNRRDQHHERVLKFSRDFRARLLTTDWVLMEVADALAESECRGRVREFILHLRGAAACEIIPATREWLDRARPAPTRRPPHGKFQPPREGKMGFNAKAQRRGGAKVETEIEFRNTSYFSMISCGGNPIR